MNNSKELDLELKTTIKKINTKIYTVESIIENILSGSEVRLSFDNTSVKTGLIYNSKDIFYYMSIISSSSWANPDYIESLTCNYEDLLKRLF